MRRLHLLVLSLVAVIALSLAMRNAAAQPHDGPPPQEGGQQGQNDRSQGDRPPGDRPQGARPPGGGGFHLIPRFAEEKLELSDDQKEQIKQLEADVKTRLEAILTPEQMKILATARPPRPNNNGGEQGGGGQNSRGPNNGNRPPRPAN